MRPICSIVLLSILLTACDDITVAGDTVSITNDTWQSANKVEFSMPVMDSINSYHLFFTVRNTNKYPFSNLYLIATLKYPHGKTVVDTIEYKMAKPDGSWLGNGIGSVKESKLYYKENFIFKELGAYQLTMEQAVRDNGDVQGVSSLIGISNVGYSIEKIE